MMELSRLPTTSIRGQRRKQATTEIDITLRPRWRSGTSAFNVLNAAIAGVVSTKSTFIGDQPFIRIAVGVSGEHGHVVIGFYLHQPIRRVVLKALRCSTARNQGARLIARRVVSETVGGYAVAACVIGK